MSDTVREQMRAAAESQRSELYGQRIAPAAQGGFLQALEAPTRYIVLPAAPIVAPGLDSLGLPLKFAAGSGFIIGWRGIVVDPGPPAAAGELEQAMMGVKLLWNDSAQLITNGQSEDFASFSTIFRNAHPFAPLLRRIEKNDILTVTYRNFNPAGVGQPSLLARLTFAVLRDDDIR